MLKKLKIVQIQERLWCILKQYLLVNWKIERMYSFLLLKSKLEGQITWQNVDAAFNDFTDLESENVYLYLMQNFCACFR